MERPYYLTGDPTEDYTTFCEFSSKDGRSAEERFLKGDISLRTYKEKLRTLPFPVARKFYNSLVKRGDISQESYQNILTRRLRQEERKEQGNKPADGETVLLDMEMHSLHIELMRRL